LRSASRNSATVFASKPARLAPRDAPRAVVFAALRAFCWRPRAWPPFLAAALRLADVERELEERALEERELDERELEVLRLRELDEVDRFEPLDLLPPDRFDPPELPLLRRSAICYPS
jgi:hypothetical protein